MVLLIAGCGDGEDGTVVTTATTIESTSTPPTSVTTTTVPPTTAGAPTGGSGQECADVIAVTIESQGAGFDIAATVSSGDTGWDKYADAWQVRSPDGTLLGERVLAHPHENEQPFTRSLSDVAIPTDVPEVVVAARDSVAGFCGAEFTVAVPHP